MVDVLGVIFISSVIIAVSILAEFLFFPHRKQEENIKEGIIVSLIIILLFDFVFILARYEKFRKNLIIYLTLRAKEKEREIARKLGIEAKTSINNSIVYIRDMSDPQKKKTYIIDIGPDGILSTKDDQIIGIFNDDKTFREQDIWKSFQKY